MKFTTALLNHLVYQTEIPLVQLKWTLNNDITVIGSCFENTCYTILSRAIWSMKPSMM